MLLHNMDGETLMVVELHGYGTLIQFQADPTQLQADFEGSSEIHNLEYEFKLVWVTFPVNFFEIFELLKTFHLLCRGPSSTLTPVVPSGKHIWECGSTLLESCCENYDNDVFQLLAMEHVAAPVGEPVRRFLLGWVLLDFIYVGRGMGDSLNWILGCEWQGLEECHIEWQARIVWDGPQLRLLFLNWILWGMPELVEIAYSSWFLGALYKFYYRKYY
ncbi:hypothetical protein TEA_002325 [Camellia sinensis var. sinensis]|uniref:Uncharacterized protein n=1 Tax=Camellia sinensis var. sinensis TaxID=542762 RepID=A0A4S4DRK5_CAMSN|nr:hypothetical protein TEA_002325 [Camellia sinensis var. sinensis]